MGDELVRRRSRRAGAGRRQGDIPAGAGGGRPVLDRLQIFNTLLLFPFVGVFERVLSRVGRTAAEDIEDYSMPKYLKRELSATSPRRCPPCSRRPSAISRPARCSSTSRAASKTAPSDPGEHYLATDISEPRHPRLLGLAVQGRHAL